MPTIYFDENFSQYVAAGFHSFEIPDGHFKVFSTTQVFGFSATDEDIVKKMNKGSEFLITQDSDFKRTTQLIQLIRDNKIGVFLFRPPKGAKYWDLLHYLYRAWPEIKGVCRTKAPPFMFEFKAKGRLSQLQL